MSDPNAEPRTSTKAEDVPLIADFAKSADLSPADYFQTLWTMFGALPNIGRGHILILLQMAKRYGLDPLHKEIGLMAVKGAVSVYVGIDGWIRVMTTHPDYLGHDVTIAWPGKPFEGRPTAATVAIRSKKRDALGMGPFMWTELLRECERDTGPWKSNTMRMLAERAMMQGARMLWNLHVPLDDELERANEFDADAPAKPEAPKPTANPVFQLPAASPVEVMDVGAAQRQAVTVPAELVPPTRPHLPEYDPAASRELDAEIARRESEDPDLFTRPRDVRPAAPAPRPASNGANDVLDDLGL